MIEDMEESKVLDEHLLKKETALELIDLVKNRHIMYDAVSYTHLDVYKRQRKKWWRSVRLA